MKSDYLYHVLDETTPWCAFLEYAETCYQLNVPEQPSIGRFMKYRQYLKEVGVIK